MQSRIGIVFQESWLKQQRNRNVPPVRALAFYIKRLPSAEVTLRSTSSCEVRFDSDVIAVSELEEKIMQFLDKRYPGTDWKEAVDIRELKTPDEVDSASDPDDELPFPDLLDLDDDFDPEEPEEEKPDVMEKIRALVGADEFKALAEECVQVAPSLIKHKTQDTFMRRCYLFAINEGEGMSTYLQLFADLLRQLQIAPIDTRTPTVEITLPSTQGKDSNPFSTATSTIRRHSSSHRVICIDMSECMTFTHERSFREFLQQVDDYSGKCVIIFRVPFVEKEVLDGIKKGMSDILYVREVALPPFGTQELMCCAQESIAERGFTIDPQALPVLEARIIEEKSDGRFYGINTINKVIREMIYLKQLKNSASGVDDTLIKPEEIADLVTQRDDSEKSGLDMLDDFIGMEQIKQRIEEIVVQVEMSLKNPGLGSPCIHMRFVGNPGTGKTTVARVLGKILKERGILRNGRFFEHSGRDFCGRYVGETAPKTTAMCRDAYGSVLFIDEAYSLYRAGSSSVDYGREAIDTLIAEMENHRSDLVVIMAGYTDEMATLMQANPGLESRMPYVIEFPNYTREQLKDIFMAMAKRNFVCGEGLEEAVKTFFDSLPDEVINAKDFSNARYVRNLFERTWSKAGLRMYLNKNDKTVLLPEDFFAASSEKEFNKLMKKKNRTLGFV